MLQYLNGLLAFFIGLTISAGQSKPDCAPFKTGILYHKGENGVVLTRIIRTEKRQMEEYVPLNAKASFLIYWTSPCSYELVFESGDAAAMKVIDTKRKVIVQIIQTTDSSYVAKGWLEGSMQRLKAEIVRREK